MNSYTYKLKKQQRSVCVFSVSWIMLLKEIWTPGENCIVYYEAAIVRPGANNYLLKNDSQKSKQRIENKEYMYVYLIFFRIYI